MSPKTLKQTATHILPDKEALCPVVVPPFGCNKFHINSCLIQAASPWGTKDSPCPSLIASYTYSHQRQFGLVLGQHGGGGNVKMCLRGNGLA